MLRIPGTIVLALLACVAGSSLLFAADGPEGSIKSIDQTAVTADRALDTSVPAGYGIRAIYVTNATANAVGGGINIGTTPGGSDVVAGFAVAGNSFRIVPHARVRRSAFSAAAPQTLYVSAATSWNAASVNIMIKLAAAKDSQGGIIKDIVADFGARCDGNPEHDDTAAFGAFQTAMAGRSVPVTLIIPPGHTCMFVRPPAFGCSATSGVYFSQGIKDLTVIGYGAALQQSGTACGYYLGGFGIQNNSTTSALFKTVSPGVDSVAMVTAAQASRFRAGSWVVATAVDTQGGGYPPNPAIYEFLQVRSSNAHTGIVTFTTPLKYGYKSTYPTYWAGRGFSFGGPATLYALPASWDATVVWMGLTFLKVPPDKGQMYGANRSITFVDAVFPGGGYNCFTPSVSQSVTFINTAMPNCAMEVDKIIERLSFVGGNYRHLIFQSQAPHLLTADGATIGIVNGTPENTVFNNVSVTRTLKLGTIGYGISKSFSCYRCNIASLVYTNLRGGPVNTATYKFGADGIITLANADSPVPWAVPGGNYYFRGLYANEGHPFQITDITQDAKNTYIHTTLKGLPNVPGLLGKIWVNAHPAPKFTCIECTGSADVVDLAQAPPGAPIYSYSKRTYTCATIAGAPDFHTWGNLVRAEYDVTTADTTQATIKAHAEYAGMLDRANTQVIHKPQVNLKAAGTRIVTPSGVTGLQPGDSITSPGTDWYYGVNGISLTPRTNPSGASPCLGVTVTIETDQHVVNQR